MNSGQGSNIDLRQGGAVSVVVVEDDLSDRAQMKEILTAAEMAVLETDSAAQLYRQLDLQAWNWRPRAFFVDLVLPGGISGYDVIRRLSERYAGAKKVPIIVVSKLTTGDDILEAQFAGADVFVHKPFNPENLLRALSEAESNQQKSPDERSQGIIVIK